MTAKSCGPCEGGVPPLEGQEVQEYLGQLKTQWTVEGNKQIVRTFKFKNFKKTMDFVNKVADIAETEQHHPDIYITYGRADITLTTHAIGGLSENDFIVAAKIEQLPEIE